MEVCRQSYYENPTNKMRVISANLRPLLNYIELQLLIMIFITEEPVLKTVEYQNKII